MFPLCREDVLKGLEVSFRLRSDGEFHFGKSFRNGTNALGDMGVGISVRDFPFEVALLESCRFFRIGTARLTPAGPEGVSEGDSGPERRITAILSSPAVL